MSENKREERKKPHWFVLQAIAAMILVGMVLLMLPISSRNGVWTDPLTAFFMSTSATCVTGQTLVEISTYYSTFGQMVLLCLCQIGGLGFMTMAVFLLILAGRRLSLQNETTVMNTLGVTEAGELKKIVLQVIIFTFACELVGALVLAIRWKTAHGMSFPIALYQGVFHSICAFCGSGFSLYPDSLVSYRADSMILTVVMGLIILGGLGFLVISEMIGLRLWRQNLISRGRLSLHSRIVLAATFFLVFTGALLFGILEWNHSLTGAHSNMERMVGAMFQSVTARTAGFTVVDMDRVYPATRLLTIVLMFIGGAPGSIAGGVKVTTVVILLAAMFSMVRGKQEVALMGRTISTRAIGGALAVFVLSLMFLLILYGSLLVTEQANIFAGILNAEKLFFDTVSSFATTGLSTGAVGGLSDAGKIIIIICMFLGRCGPLSIALLVSFREQRQLLRYPEEDVMVG